MAGARADKWPRHTLTDSTGQTPGQAGRQADLQVLSLPQEKFRRPVPDGDHLSGMAVWSEIQEEENGVQDQ